jgi:hypothetical protein
LMGVSCATASLCWVSGAVVPSEIPWTSGSPISIDSAQVQGLLAATQDGGQSWQTIQPSPSLEIGLVPAVSCPTSTSCFALGYQRATSGQGAFVLLSYEG